MSAHQKNNVKNMKKQTTAENSFSDMYIYNTPI